MKTDLIHALTDSFDSHAQQTENGVEFWLARDIQHLLGYSKWENFLNVVSKARTACEVSGHQVQDHFPDVRKMVDLGSGSQREVDDIMLTRYACYLIAQNGDPKKQEIAFAQTYFAIQTRRAELIGRRLLEAERVSARKKLTATEKELSQVTGSDLDVLVAFDGPATSARYFGVQFCLEDLFGCAVDLVTEKGLWAELRPFIEKESVRI